MTTRTAALFLDSADLADAAAAAASGIVSGVTTNPSIMGRPRGEHPARLRRLLDTFPAVPVFYQLTATDPASADAEVATVLTAAGEHRSRVVLKLPAQEWLYPVADRLVGAGHEVAFTAVYSAGQALCAAATGASWLIPYVDRARRLDPGAGPLVPRLVAAVPPEVLVLAASIKSAEQAVEAVLQGAAGVTAAWPVLQSLTGHPLTESAVATFQDELAAPA